MLFETPLLKGTLIRRYKRFLADIELDNGQVVTAHCPNTGAMIGCAEPGFTAWLSRSDNPKRKLAYTWELAQNHNKQWIGINTHNANKLVAEALSNRKIDVLSKWDKWQAEVTPPGKEGRLDFLLSHQERQTFVEVKSVTLLEGNTGFFPDAVTQRGTRHCQMLTRLSEQGYAAQLVFCVQHTGISEVRIAQHIDPVYTNALKEALDKGVKLIALGCKIDEEKMSINQQLPVFV